MIELRAELENLPARVAALRNYPKYGEPGLRRAINRTAARMRAQSTRGIVARVRLKSTYVREQLRVTQSTPARTAAFVIARRRATRLDRFPHSQLWKRGKNGKRVRAGIRVSILKGRPPETLPSAFLAPLRSGRGPELDQGNRGIAIRRSVLRRIGQLTKGPEGVRGRAFDVLHGISMADLFSRELDIGASADAERYFSAQIDAELRRAKARARA